MTDIAFDPNALGAETGKFKAACVRAENASTPWARMTLAGLLTGKATPSSVTILLLTAFGTPKTPKGKASDTISGLRYATGGDAARKAAEAVFAISADCGLDDSIRKVVVDFVLERQGGARTLKALRDAVKAAVAAFNATQGADEAAEQADDTTPEENGETPPVEETGPSVAFVANQLIAMLEGGEPLSDMDRDSLALLMLAIGEASRVDEDQRQAA